jgi:hypothetical protein
LVVSCAGLSRPEHPLSLSLCQDIDSDDKQQNNKTYIPIFLELSYLNWYYGTLTHLTKNHLVGM